MSSTGVEIIDRPDMYASVFMYGTNPRNRRVNQLNYDAVGKIRSYEGVDYYFVAKFYDRATLINRLQFRGHQFF